MNGFPKVNPFIILFILILSEIVFIRTEDELEISFYRGKTHVKPTRPTEPPQLELEPEIVPEKIPEEVPEIQPELQPIWQPEYEPDTEPESEYEPSLATEWPEWESGISDPENQWNPIVITNKPKPEGGWRPVTITTTKRPPKPEPEWTHPTRRTTPRPQPEWTRPPPTRRTTPRPEPEWTRPTRRTTPKPEPEWTHAPPTRRTTPRPEPEWTHPTTRRTTPRPEPEWTQTTTMRTTSKPEPEWTHPTTQRTTTTPEPKPETTTERPRPEPTPEPQIRTTTTRRPHPDSESHPFPEVRPGCEAIRCRKGYRCDCFNPCPPSCKNPTQKPCRTYGCKPTCVCDKGYVMSDNNTCIPLRECQRPPTTGAVCDDLCTNGKQCGCDNPCPATCANPDPIPCPTLHCNAGCYTICRKGFVLDRIGGDCIPLHYCPNLQCITQQCNQHENEVYHECSTRFCNRTCKNPNPRCTEQCIRPGNYDCRPGFVRDLRDGRCVPQQHCNQPIRCERRGEVFYECDTRMCQRTCQKPNPICTDICLQPGNCDCRQGLVRDVQTCRCVEKNESSCLAQRISDD